jgi:hypothetical protein
MTLERPDPWSLISETGSKAGLGPDDVKDRFCLNTGHFITAHYLYERPLCAAGSIGQRNTLIL